MTFKKYLELIKFNISILVLVECYIGYYLGLRFNGLFMIEKTSLIVFIYLLIGTFLSSSGASILNQYFERSYDAKMDRTKNRPIPSNAIKAKRALLLGLVLSLFGPLFLVYKVNYLTGIISFITIFTYVCIYTPSKRITSLNTLIGSVPGALPPVGGWAAATGKINAESIMVFGILFCWQIPHFLSLAIIYKDDYKKGGFKMLPSVANHKSEVTFQILFFTMALIYTSVGIYILNMTSYVYVVGATMLGLIFLFYSSSILFDYSSKSIKRIFLFSIIYLPVLLLMILLDTFFK